MHSDRNEAGCPAIAQAGPGDGARRPSGTLQSAEEREDSAVVLPHVSPNTSVFACTDCPVTSFRAAPIRWGQMCRDLPRELMNGEFSPNGTLALGGSRLVVLCEYLD